MERRNYGLGVASLLGMALLLIGIPAALLALAGNPLPALGTLKESFTTPDLGGRLFIGSFLPLVGWVAWASFAVPLILQMIGLGGRVFKGLSVQQRIAVAMVAAVGGMFVAPGSGLRSSGDSAQAVSSSSAPLVQTPEAKPAAPSQSSITAPAAEPASQKAPLPTYEVKAGDTLYSIAQAQLGDGHRFQEIAELNYGVVQGDGSKLGADHWLRAGWTLKLPADAAQKGRTHTEKVTVQPGDTLWDIAERELGSGERYPELAQATADDVQADGQRLTDPNLIMPGWTVEVPAQVHVDSAAKTLAPKTQTPKTQAPDASTGHDQHPDTSTQAPVPAPQQAGPAADQDRVPGVDVQPAAPEGPGPEGSAPDQPEAPASDGGSIVTQPTPSQDDPLSRLASGSAESQGDRQG